MKTPLLFLVLMLMTLETNARKIIEIKIEPAVLEARYERRKVLDTLDMENDFRVDLLTLKIGKSTSAFYSAGLKTVDSIEYRNRDAAMARLDNYEMYKSVSRLPDEAVFKNYPEGKTRVHDRFDFCQWRIDEDIKKPVWNITDTSKTIMGYDCILAYTEYRGRKWEAWFTPEIPIPDGPWKLCGLPGLILSASDSKGHYRYDAVSILNKNIGDVEYFDYDAGNRLSVSRGKALPRKWKSMHEDIRYMILSSGMYGVHNPNIKKREHIPHTNYDFEETDYPHD